MKKNLQNKNFSDHKNKWKKTILSIHASVQDCLKNLNISGLRISLIVNDKEEFQGTVTDGDIRKALVDGIDLKNSIRKIINRNAFIVSPKMKSETVLQIMIKNKVQQISRERISENVDFLGFILGRSNPEEIALWRKKFPRLSKAIKTVLKNKFNITF